MSEQKVLSGTSKGGHKNSKATKVTVIGIIILVGCLAVALIRHLRIEYANKAYNEQGRIYFLVKAGWQYTRAESLLGMPKHSSWNGDSTVVRHYYPTNPLFNDLCIEVAESTGMVQAVWFIDLTMTSDTIEMLNHIGTR